LILQELSESFKSVNIDGNESVEWSYIALGLLIMHSLPLRTATQPSRGLWALNHSHLPSTHPKLVLNMHMKFILKNNADSAPSEPTAEEIDAMFAEAVNKYATVFFFFKT
jgi:hypothetical protein